MNTKNLCTKEIIQGEHKTCIIKYNFWAGNEIRKAQISMPLLLIVSLGVAMAKMVVFETSKIQHMIFFIKYIWKIFFVLPITLYVLRFKNVL